MEHPKLGLASALALVTLALPVTAARAASEEDPSVSPTRLLIEHYSADLGALERRYEVPASDARRDRMRRFYEDELRRLGDVHFDNLDQPGRIDYLLLQNKLRFELKHLEQRRRQLAEVADLVPFAPAVVRLDEDRQRGHGAAAEQSARTLGEIASQLATVRKHVEEMKVGEGTSKDLPSAVVADRAGRLVDELRETLKDWHGFYAGYDPEFTWWMKEPYPKLEKDLAGYADLLRKRLAGYVEGQEDPVIGDPIGREALLDALAAEMIPYSPEELIDVAGREFAWCDGEMKKAAHDLGCGDDWHKALDRVSRDHVKPGEQPQLIEKLAQEATKFVKDRNLVTVPSLCEESWRMEMMSPKRQRVNPYFTGGEVISVSFPTDDMTLDDKLMSMRGNNVAFCRATVFHELIPGHHLQLFMAQRYNAHRRAFATPFYVEGWALYWEMRLWDLGFARTPEERVGMLFWRAHRCARIIFSLKFHLGQMTAPQAIDFLVERVGHERRNATAEVRRSVNGAYGPLYQAAYLLGGLQLRALHGELVNSGKMTELAFHDAVLRENAIPIDMVRASLAGRKLSRDYQPTWRFYDAAPATTRHTGE